MCLYCSDHYGSVLWDLNNPLVEDFCVAWRKGLRRSFDLPRCTHSLFVPVICGLLPIKYELSFRQAVFTFAKKKEVITICDKKTGEVAVFTPARLASFRLYMDEVDDQQKSKR